MYRVRVAEGEKKARMFLRSHFPAPNTSKANLHSSIDIQPLIQSSVILETRKNSLPLKKKISTCLMFLKNPSQGDLHNYFIL